MPNPFSIALPCYNRQKEKMTLVDIVLKKESGYDVISKQYIGGYTGSNMLRKEFGILVKWARKNKVRTGKWLMFELDGPDTPSDRRRWEACVEVKKDSLKKVAGLSENRDGIEFKKLAPQRVASVTFDPDKFSSRLVYHGLECWLDWRKKYGELEDDGPTREVYVGNPWTNSKAWASTEVQLPVKTIKK